MCSPSYSNHIGLTWTVSSGRIVPSAPNSGRSSSGRSEEGMSAAMASVADREQEELRELRGGEVVVADEHERLASVAQARPEGDALDVVERDPERVEVEQQLLARRPHAVREREGAVDVGRAGQRDAVELDLVAGAGRAGRERALHGD